ncbi:MAG: TetR family transcriptional regulator [Streptosporangiales bacterium]|nr:TetR family transcriptional regulator [Streptosporangiales bacterium]
MRQHVRPGAGPGGRQAVLEAAALAFTRNGYTATSIDDIADVLVATKGRVYHYYRSKLDIFLDVMISGMRELTERVGPVAGDLRLGPTERLRQMARIHATLMMTRHSFQRVAVQGIEMHLAGSLRPRQRRTWDEIIAMRDRYEQLFADVVEAGQGSGEFRETPARLATKPLLGALNWTTIWYRPEEVQQEGAGPAVQRIADELAEFVVGGLRKVPDT